MNAPRTAPAIPASLAIPLAILAAFAPTAAARLRLDVIALAECKGAPALLARLAPGLVLAFVPGALDRHTLAAAISAAGYAVTTPANPSTWRRLADAMIPGAAGERVDPASLAAFLESLPASVHHVALSTVATRAVDAAHLRAVASAAVTLAPSETLTSSRRVYHDGEASAAGVVIAGDGWRVLLASTPLDALDGKAPAFDAERPVALACATCGHVAPLRHAHAYSAQMEALRRRWTLRDTDEGAVFACRPCSLTSNHSPENAR